MLTSTSPGSTREAMDAAFAGPDPLPGAVPGEPDEPDPPEGNWPNPPAAAPLKPLTPAALELPMASPMTPPAVPATSNAATPPATASARRPRLLPPGFWPPGPAHPAWPPGGAGGGPYAQP